MVSTRLQGSGKERDYLRVQDLHQLRRLVFTSKRVVEGQYSGRHASPLRGQSVEFSDYREYVPGDEIGGIDWKVYGRSDKLFIKLLEHQTDMTVNLLVDASASMGYGGRPPGGRRARARYAPPPSCATAGCHAGGAPAAGLNLDAANSYMMLVGIVSNQDANFQRVLPGDPDASYLIQKMEGTAAVGGIMPPGTGLPQTTIDVIRQWITDGAIDDRVVVSNPIRVASMFPMPGVDLATAPTQIMAGFDRDLDTSTINANTFIVTASGGDGTFNDGNEAQI